jgi:molybdate transport system substrate-binding protein
MHADAGDGSRVAMAELHVLSAGAAKGIVDALAPALRAATGTTLRCEFGAVGAIREAWLAGARCDVLILTGAMLEALTHEGRVDAATVTPLGRVHTGVAVRVGEPLPDIGDRQALRRTLLAATGLYLPDTQRSTAGGHCIAVLQALEIHADLVARVHAFANGAAAMRELAQAHEPGLIGCTQITEILYTPGVTLVGPLPREFELATVYSAAVATTAQEPLAARRFVQLLTAPESRELRRNAGFEV